MNALKPINTTFKMALEILGLAVGSESIARGKHAKHSHLETNCINFETKTERDGVGDCYFLPLGIHN